MQETQQNLHPIVDQIFALADDRGGKLDIRPRALKQLKPELKKMDDVELASALTSVVAFAGFLSKDCDAEQAATHLLEWALDAGKPLMAKRSGSKAAAHQIAKLLGQERKRAPAKRKTGATQTLRDIYVPRQIEHHAGPPNPKNLVVRPRRLPPNVRKRRHKLPES